MIKHMKKPNRETILMAIIITLFLIAYIPAFLLWRYDMHVHPCFKHIRNIIYIGLFAAWGISIRHRIIQEQAQRYLLAIACLMVLWIVIRSIKWLFVDDVNFGRYLWYSFYIPMLLIPVMGIFLVLSLGKPEHYSPPKALSLVMLPAALLLIMVLTNDYHQLVFKFPEIPGGIYGAGYSYSNNNYSYNMGYFLIVAWSLLIALATLGLMNLKCRVPRTRKIIWQPFTPLASLIVYGILYALNWAPLRLFARDMTVIFCLLITAIWESCIRKGLIQSNSRYDELFRTAAIGAQIIDNGGNVFLASDGALSVDKELLFKAQAEPVLFPNGIRLSSSSIIGGHFIWQENVSQLTKLLAELENMNESLQGRNITLQTEQKTLLRRQHLVEQNRIYKIMQNQTKDKVYHLSVLLDRLENTNNMQILKQIAVLTAYLKRRNNLIFLAEDSNEILAVELQYCIRESVHNLDLFGISCAYDFELKDSLPIIEMTKAYDVFETIIEKSLDTLTSLHLHIKKEHAGIILTIILTAQTDLSELNIENLTIEQEEDKEWRLVYCTGGEEK